MERLGHPAREIPHAADKGQFDNLPGGKMFFHGLKSGFVLFCPQVSNLIRPPNCGFFFIRKKIAILPSITMEKVNLFLRKAQSSTELYIVAHSIVAFGNEGGLDNDQLLDFNIFRVFFEIINPYLLIE